MYWFIYLLIIYFLFISYIFFTVPENHYIKNEMNKTASHTNQCDLESFVTRLQYCVRLSGSGGRGRPHLERRSASDTEVVDVQECVEVLLNIFNLQDPCGEIWHPHSFRITVYVILSGKSIVCSCMAFKRTKGALVLISGRAVQLTLQKVIIQMTRISYMLKYSRTVFLSNSCVKKIKLLWIT